MSTNTNKSMLSGIYQMGKTIRDNAAFSSLNDTPTGYLGHSGNYMIVNDGESGIHFTGIEKIAADLTDYGFGGGSSDIPKYTNLPDPTSNDGKIVASGCDLYYGCDGEWKKVGADAIPPPENVPGCVSNLEEYNQYQEYKEQFLAENSATAFDQMLNFNNDISELIYDVCLFSDNNLSSVKIDETTYKWGMFANTQTVNITATPGVASDREIQFSHWAGDGAVFGDANSSQTTLLVDKDLSVTGYFSEILEGTCEDVALHVQSNTTDGDVTFTDQSSNTHTITRFGDTQHSTTNAYLGSTSMVFDGAGDVLKLTNIDLTDISTSNFTCEFWFNTPALRNDTNTAGGNSPRLITDGVNLADRGLGIKLSDDKLLIDLSQSPTGGQTSGNHWELKDFSVAINTWYHVALVRNNDRLYVYINGIKYYINGLGGVASQVNLEYLDCGKLFISDYLCIGGVTESIGTYQGHIQDLRISKKAIYTTNFTPPNSLLNNPCPVQLACEDVILHAQSPTQKNLASTAEIFQLGSDTIIDNTNTLFGESSYQTTSDEVVVTDMSVTSYLEGTQDFTFETWFRTTDRDADLQDIFQEREVTRDRSFLYWMYRGTQSLGKTTGYFDFNLSNGHGAWRAEDILLAIAMTSPVQIENDTWYHLAIVRRNVDNWAFYVNGIPGQVQSLAGDGNSYGSLSNSLPVFSGPTKLFGIEGGATVTRNFQDFRITKKAIYTTNFTPPNSLLNNPC